MSQTNRAIKAFDKGRFAGILDYHDKYFEGSAWLVLGISRFQVAKEKGEAMGIAAGTATHAHELFQGMQGALTNIPADYAPNFNNKLKQSGDMAKMATDKAKNVFFEKVPDFNQITVPDMKNFVKFDATAKEELDKVPMMNETLRHVIPPEVRKMVEEIKQYLQNQIDQQYKFIETKTQE